MATRWPLHRRTIGRTREVRGPDAMERLAAGAVTCVVVGIAIGFAVHQVRMAQTLDAVSLASAPFHDSIVYRAVHGNWPPAGDTTIVKGNERGTWVRTARLERDGGVTMDVTYASWLQVTGRAEPGTPEAHGILSMRPQWIAAGDFAAATLLCGHARPVAGAPPPRARDRTTVARQDLPAFCR